MTQIDKKIKAIDTILRESENKNSWEWEITWSSNKIKVYAHYKGRYYFHKKWLEIGLKEDISIFNKMF